MDSISRNLNDGAHSVEAYQVSNPQLTRIEKIKASIFKDLERVIQCNLKIGSASLLKNNLISHFILLCKNLLKPQEQGAQENEEMQRINSLFPAEGKMAETANEVNAIYLQAQEDNIIACLDKVLHQCRKEKNTYCEYLIRRLFVSLVLSGDINSTEATQKALELEWDHLNSYALFTEFPEDDQKKYDHHLENYLELLSKQLGFKLEENESLCKKMESTILNLDDLLISRELQPWPEAPILLRRHLAFLKSRPEWMFNMDRAGARVLLLDASLLENNKSIKDQIDLDLISLEFSQLKCGKNPSNDKLRNLLSRTLTLKVNMNLSAMDQFLAACLEIKIYEMLAKNKQDPNSLVATIKSKLIDAIEQGTKNSDQMNFKAICSLAECRFTLGFYCSLCCKDGDEYEKGRQLLLSLSKEFGAETKHKEAAARLSEYLAGVSFVKDCSIVDQKKFNLLEKFRFLIFKDIHSFCHSFINKNDAQGMQFKVPTEFCSGKSDEDKINVFLNDENLTIGRCRDNLIGNLLNNDLNSANELINSCMGFYYLNAEKNFKEIYYCYKSKKPELISEENEKKLLRFLKLTQDKNLGRISISLNIDAIADFVNFGIKVPFIEYFLAREELLFLDRKTEINLKISEVNEPDKCVKDVSSIPTYCEIYKLVFQEVEAHQGKLAYVSLINNTISAYINCLFSSKLLRDLFSNDLSHITKNERNEIKRLRHHVPTLLMACQLIIDMYNYAECVLSDPDESEFYFHAEHAVLIGIQVSKTKKEKFDWSKIGAQISKRFYDNHFQHVSKECNENYLLNFLHFFALQFTYITNPEERLSLSENLFAHFPDTFGELVTYLFESDPDIMKRPEKTINQFLQLALLKSKYLIYNQKVEQGFALFQECYNRFLCSIDGKKLKYPNISRIEIVIEPISKIINPARLCYDTEDYITVEQGKDSISGQDNAAEDRSHSSIKQEVLANAKNRLKRMLDKQNKKESKATVSSSMAVSATPCIPEAIVDEPSEPTIKYISKKKMTIFNRLWEQKKEFQTGAWETRSFMNNVKITRKEALSLIIALGGSYDTERGQGSHHVAHLPRIQFNGKDMGGLLNYETGELITLTNNELLDFYQIIQLRRILLSQGYNPDTVIIKVSRE